MAADERDDFRHPRHPDRQHRPHRLQRRTVGKPHAVLALPGLLQRQFQGVGGHAHVAGHLAQHLRRRRRVVADHLRHAGGEAVGELELGERPDRRLGGHVDRIAGLAHRIVDLDIAVDEDPVPRHQHVVEDAEGILLVETRRQRLVERIGSRRRCRIATQEFQAGRVERNGEGHRILGGTCRDRLPGIHRLLVGVGCEGGQHATAPDDDAVGRFADLSHRDLVAQDPAVGPLVDGGLDDRMGERKIRLGQAALEGHEVLRAPLVASVGAGPHPGRRREGRELHVHVVGRAAHDAHGAFRQPDEPGMAMPQLVPGPRDHVTDVGGLAAVRVHEEAVGRIGVLPVEDRGQAFGAAPQLGMRGDVLDPLAVDPDLTPRLAEPF